MSAVVGSINASYPGLEAFATSVRAGDLNSACEELVLYYQKHNKSVRSVEQCQLTMHTTKSVWPSLLISINMLLNELLLRTLKIGEWCALQTSAAVCSVFFARTWVHLSRLCMFVSLLACSQKRLCHADRTHALQ